MNLHTHIFSYMYVSKEEGGHGLYSVCVGGLKLKVFLARGQQLCTQGGRQCSTA